MTGGKSQSDRVLIDAHSRSARAHGERMLAALPHKDRLQSEWNDTNFNAAHNFKMRWIEGKAT